MLIFITYFSFCVYQELNLLQFVFGFYIIIIIADAFEMWLKFKHRTSCLKRLISHDNNKIKTVVCKLQTWVAKLQMNFIYLRDRNHTKVSIFFVCYSFTIFFIHLCIIFTFRHFCYFRLY